MMLSLFGGSSRIPNPDEAVAYGAAVQAALLNEGIENVPNLVLFTFNIFRLM